MEVRSSAGHPARPHNQDQASDIKEPGADKVSGHNNSPDPADASLPSARASEDGNTASAANDMAPSDTQATLNRRKRDTTPTPPDANEQAQMTVSQTVRANTELQTRMSSVPSSRTLVSEKISGELSEASGESLKADLPELANQYQSRLDQYSSPEVKS